MRVGSLHGLHESGEGLHGLHESGESTQAVRDEYPVCDTPVYIAGAQRL